MSENQAAPGAEVSPQKPPSEDKPDLFQVGYGKGADKGRKEILETAGFSSVDELKDFVTQQKKAQEESLAQQGKYKELLETRQSEYEKLSSEAAEWKSGYEQWNDYQKNRRESLLEKLPEDQREIYGSLPLNGLEKHIELMGEGKPYTPPARPGSASSMPYKNLIELSDAFVKGDISKKQYDEYKTKL